MAQLKMYRPGNMPDEKPVLPEGYSYSLYKGEEDIEAWLACCRRGLIDDDAGVETFVSRIERHDDCDMFRDVIFLDYNGEHIGTVTAIRHPDSNMGEMHMVGIRPDFRGRGLGRFLNCLAVEKLCRDGVRFIELTTDEWRKAAVKSYLSAGFLPVEYDEGMKQRWKAVLNEHGIDSVDMLFEDGSFCCTLKRD